MSRTRTIPYIMYKGVKIEPGHPVHILASRPGARDGFDANIIAIYLTKDDKIDGIEVLEPKTRTRRVFFLSRVRPYLYDVERRRQANLKTDKSNETKTNKQSI